jgi:hypothetical protein
MPTGTDLLMFIAPKATKYSLNNHKEPFVKIPNLMHGYDMYERYYDKYDSAWRYKPSTVRLNIKNVTPEQKEEILYEYNTNSIVPFPKLHNMLLEGSILNLEDGNTIADMVELFSSYIRQNKVLIYKIC